METEGLSDTNVETLRQLFGVMETWYCTNLKLSLKWRVFLMCGKIDIGLIILNISFLVLERIYKTFPGKIFVFSYFSCKNEDLSILNKFSLKWIIMFYDIITVKQLTCICAFYSRCNKIKHVKFFYKLLF